jgi:hypothetical protein
MKTTALFLFCFIFTTSFSQNHEEKDKKLTHGIQFQIRGLELQSFDSYTFSYRYLLTKKSGFRIGINTELSSTEGDSYQQVDTLVITPPLYDKKYGFTISAQYLHSILSYKEFDFILGLGAFFSFSERSRESSSLWYTNIENYYDYVKSTYLGFDIIIGAEYRLTENVVFSGEYGLSVSNGIWKNEYSSSTVNYLTQERFHHRKRVDDYDILAIGGTGVKLGLAIFF